MADTKITALTALTAADPANDVIPIVDVSDTSMAASGTTKKISVNNILGASGTATLASATITGAATVGTTLGVTGNLTVDTNTLVANASTDTVGIGTTSTDAKFRILDASGNGVRIGFLPGTFNYNLYDATVHEFRSPAGTNSFGAITANGIGLGLTPSTSGIGVWFNPVQSASSDANCLDDYEEGTWTPSIGGTATYTGQTGTYTKIGNRVYFSLRLSVLVAGTGEDFRISGLPFTSGSGLFAVSVGYFSTLKTNAAFLSGYVTGTQIGMTGTTVSAATMTNLIGVIGNGTDIAISGFYNV